MLGVNRLELLEHAVPIFQARGLRGRTDIGQARVCVRRFAILVVAAWKLRLAPRPFRLVQRFEALVGGRAVILRVDERGTECGDAEQNDPGVIHRHLEKP